MPSLPAICLACWAAFAVHLAALSYTEFVAPDLAPGIVDLGFLFLPEAPRGYGEVVPYALLAALVATRREALPEFALQGAGLMAARALCVAATVLPPTYEGCRAGALSALHGGCRDKVFSGHAAYTALMALHLREGASALAAGPALAAAVAAEALYLVAAREHYSVDVLVALLLALLAFCASRGALGPAAEKRGEGSFFGERAGA